MVGRACCGGASLRDEALWRGCSIYVLHLKRFLNDSSYEGALPVSFKEYFLFLLSSDTQALSDVLDRFFL